MNLANEDRVMGITTQSYLENPAAFARCKSEIIHTRMVPSSDFSLQKSIKHYFRKISKYKFLMILDINTEASQALK